MNQPTISDLIDYLQGFDDQTLPVFLELSDVPSVDRPEGGYITLDIYFEERFTNDPSLAS